MPKRETQEERALRIAAKVCVAAGLCRHDDVLKCRRLYPTEKDCENCIKQWFMAKAKKELQAVAAHE